LVLLKGAKEAVLLATSDAAGKHTFSFAPEDAHYQLVVKKVGFVQSARLVPVAPGDTFSIQLSLAQLGVTVPPGWDIQAAFAPCCPLDERTTAGQRYAARARLSPVA